MSYVLRYPLYFLRLSIISNLTSSTVPLNKLSSSVLPPSSDSYIRFACFAFMASISYIRCKLKRVLSYRSNFFFSCALSCYDCPVAGRLLPSIFLWNEADPLNPVLVPSISDSRLAWLIYSLKSTILTLNPHAAVLHSNQSTHGMTHFLSSIAPISSGEVLNC